jgi:hypothetical protein
VVTVILFFQLHQITILYNPLKIFLGAENVLKSLEVVIRTNNALELLEGELIAAQQLFNHLFVERNAVLFEKVDTLVDVETAGAVGIKLGEDGLDDLVLLDLLVAHEVLPLDLHRVVLGGLLELVELHLLF